MEYLNIGLVYVFEYLITLSFCNRVMDKKIKYSSILVSTLPLYAIGLAIYFIFENTLLNTVISFFMYFLTMLFGYNEKLYKRIIYAIYLTIIAHFSESIFFIFVYQKYQPITKNDEIIGIQQLLIAMTVKIIHFILAQLLALIINRKDFSGNKKLLPLFIYPAISLAFTIEFMSLTAKYNYTHSETIVYIVISCIDAIMCIAIFMYYGLIDDKDRKLKELEKEQQFIELNNSYMQVLEHQNNDMRMLAHDTKNHYNAIANMESIEEVRSYISNVVHEVQSYQIIRLTNNKMLDLLLSKYKVECNSKGIKLNTEIKTANLNYIDDSDLSILICNLLDNAVEAATQSKAKTISFSLRKVNEFDVLNIINSCDTEPDVKNNKIITSKADKSAHGYGMKIVSKYAKKNNAEYEWHYDNESNTFNSTLIFKR